MTMREATQEDRPRIDSREAQCPLCWRIFGSDSTCELHKPYSKPKTEACKEPLTLGLEARERRGVAVWVRPMPPGAAESRHAGNRANLDEP